MLSVDVFKTFIEYHLDMTRRVWESIDQITEEQFISDDAYSRGSIRNLMVHLANTDSNWLAGLKNIPEEQDAPKKKYEDYRIAPVSVRFGMRLQKILQIMLQR